MNSFPTLDAGALAILRENFADAPDVLSMVVDDFFESVDRLHGQINIALATGDAGEMARAAHSLKSNCATVGATQMADAMREIERIGRSGELAGCGDLLSRSRHVFGDLRPQLESFVRDLEAAHLS